jgi:hypothetical protein
MPSRTRVTKTFWKNGRGSYTFFTRRRETMKKSERYFLEHVRGMLQIKQMLCAFAILICIFAAIITWMLAYSKAGSEIMLAIITTVIGVFLAEGLSQYTKKVEQVDKELGD